MVLVLVIATIDSVSNGALAQSRYFVGSQVLSWTAAREYCRQRGGDLVVIETAEENEIVRRLVQQRSINPTGCWIGASDADSEGQWRWINGNSVSLYSNWDPWEPNNICGGEHYAHMWFHGKWNDQKNDGSCNSYGLMQPVCELNDRRISVNGRLLPYCGYRSYLRSVLREIWQANKPSDGGGRSGSAICLRR